MGSSSPRWHQGRRAKPVGGGSSASWAALHRDESSTFRVRRAVSSFVPSSSMDTVRPAPFGFLSPTGVPVSTRSLVPPHVWYVTGEERYAPHQRRRSRPTDRPGHWPPIGVRSASGGQMVKLITRGPGRDHFREGIGEHVSLKRKLCNRGIMNSGESVLIQE